MEERLQKILAQAGFGSRRACEELIVQRRVTINKRVAVLGDKADLTRDEVALDGEPLSAPERLTYILLHKPRGVVSSLEPQGERRTVRDLVPAKERIYPVGRLDVESEGLVLLTNDGALTDVMTHPRYETEKEYRVLVKNAPTEDQLEAWRRGVVLPDNPRRTAPAQVRRERTTPGGTWLRVIMHEGRKHEIRDIGVTLGLLVVRLIRVRLGPLLLGDLKLGDWRALTKGEVEALQRIVLDKQENPVAPKPRRPQRRPLRSTPAPARPGKAPAQKRPSKPGKPPAQKRPSKPGKPSGFNKRK